MGKAVGVRDEEHQQHPIRNQTSNVCRSLHEENPSGCIGALVEIRAFYWAELMYCISSSWTDVFAVLSI